MRKLLMIFAINLVYAGMLSIYAQQVGANISFNEIVHDFGQIQEDGGLVSYDFGFTNTGSIPLIIQNVKASCGCTSPNWTKDPIIAGRTGFVKATFNPKGRPGAFSKTVSVTSNSNKKVTVLTIKGEVLQQEKGLEEIYRQKVGDIRIKSNVVSFPSIKHDQVETRVLELYNSTTQPVKVSFDKLPAHVKITPGVKVVAPKSEDKVTLTYDASKKDDWGYTKDFVILVTNGNKNLNNHLIISANIQENFSKLTTQQRALAPKIHFEDEEYNFGKIKQGEKVEIQYKFTNTGKSPLIIRKIKAACGCTALHPHDDNIAPGESSTIKASFDSKGREGQQRKTITIISNDPNRPTVMLRLTGIVE